MTEHNCNLADEDGTSGLNQNRRQPDGSSGQLNFGLASKTNLKGRAMAWRPFKTECAADRQY